MGSISESMATGGYGRQQILKKLGIATPAKAHELILEGLKRGSSVFLIQQGLTAQRLTALGYSVEAMHKLGFDDATLLNLGFKLKEIAPPPEPSAHQSFEEDHSHNLHHYHYHFEQHSSRRQHEEHDHPSSALHQLLHHDPQGEAAAEEIRSLVRDGCKAPDLQAAGYTVDQMPNAGLSACDLKRLGFDLADMARIYSPFQLKQAGFGAGELRHHFNGEKLRKAGFEAGDLRLAGFAVRDLLRFGYDESRVCLAGFTTAELADQGLSRTKHK